MAWDALASIYRNKSEDETAQTRDNRANTGNVSSSSAVAAPMTGWGGSGGSAGAPASSKFVNFGTMYDLNKDKAAGMAKGLYDSAQAKAEGAQGKLNDARGAFAGQVAGGTAKGTIGGKHGTRVENLNPTAPVVAPSQDTVTGKRGTGGRDVSKGIGLDVSVQGIQPGGAIQPGASLNTIADQDPNSASQTAAARRATGAAALGAGRYSSLFDGLQYGEGLKSNPTDQAARADYHHSVSTLDAKSHAGQGYVGPDSLKGSMGDEAYGALGKELGDAEKGTQLGDAADIATALGYGPGSNVGMSALDAGLTQTAGRPQFKQLGEKYKGLGKLLPSAQADSMNTAAAAKIKSENTAGQWQDLLGEYESAQAAADADAKPDEKPKTPMGPKFDWNKGDMGQQSNALKLTTESGYTATEVEDIYGELTPEERAYLNRGANLVENITGYGFSGDEAKIKQNILWKLAQARSRKQGGQ